MEKGCNGVVRIIAVKVIWRALRFLARGPCCLTRCGLSSQPSDWESYDLTANHFVTKGYDIFVSYCEYNGHYRVPTGYVTGRLRMSNEVYMLRVRWWRSEALDLKWSQQTIVIVSNYLFISWSRWQCRSTCLEAQEIQQLLSMSHSYASRHIQEMAYKLKYAKTNLGFEYAPKTLQMWGWDCD